MHPMRMIDKVKVKLAEAGHRPGVRVVTVEDDKVIIQEGDNRAKVPFDQIVEIIDSTRPEKFWPKLEELGLMKRLKPKATA